MTSPIRQIVSFISTPKPNLVPQCIKNNEVVKKVSGVMGIDSPNYLQTISIMSIVLKDALGCYLYVKQSLNNKKIPEDKRAFVAALDLTNGGLMIVAQLLMFFSISNANFQRKVFDKLFGKAYDKIAKKAAATWVRCCAKDERIPKHEIYRSVDALRESTLKIFGTITSLVAASTIGKRVIVPFIATPLATYVKDKYMMKPAGDKDKTKVA